MRGGDRAARCAEGGRTTKVAALRADLERKQTRMRLVPFIDPLDVRYRRYDQIPKPVARAVMFCLMDVSGSMDEHMKDLAKRFYSLLYLFLKRRYKRVDVVFIRHTHEAKEVDEETFFHSRESGGTVVSTALEEMARDRPGPLSRRTSGTSMRRRRATATTCRWTMPTRSTC